MIVLGAVLATIAGLIIGAVVYGAVPRAATSPAPPGRPAPAVVLVELLRNGAVAGLVAGLLTAGDWSGPATGALLGAALWVLPVVLLAGSVFHEGVAPGRAAVHALDWAVKLVVIGALVASFV